jgi:hypothetical protein
MRCFIDADVRLQAFAGGDVQATTSPPLQGPSPPTFAVCSRPCQAQCGCGISACRRSITHMRMSVW